MPNSSHRPVNQPSDLEKLRHSTAHLLAAAVLEIWPDAKPAIGPAIDDGFYYDFEFGQPVSESDFPQIEQKMRQLGKDWSGFERREVSADEAKQQFPDNPYKQQLIDELAGEGQTISLYQSGGFVDLCRGGHVGTPAAEIKHFQLLSVAGAYWRGDEHNPMLTRIYGTVWPSQAELDDYLERQQQAKLRDHRRLGQELELYFIDDLVGKGLIMWLPKGQIIKDEIERLVKEMEAEAGYLRVTTPHIARQELFETSGHLPYYRDSMYPPMEMDDGAYYLKAMNCPHHHRIYQYQPRSYRDLPLRLAEYGTCYRNELSGTLAGLLRVRGMAMNDAHIYCRRDQIKAEFRAVLELTQRYFELFGLDDYWFRLSKWDPAHTDKYINEPDNWQYTESVIREVLEEMGVKFEEAADEAAFYGPKVDVQFSSVVGREETMSTIQLDFFAKGRFDLYYIDERGRKDHDVFVIHRAPLSVHERFLAFLIEHYAGAFPTWLAPVQVKVLPVSDKHLEYAGQVMARLGGAGVRAELDDRAEPLPAKVRRAQLEKVPYMLVVGEKEAAAGQVAVRDRAGRQQTVKLEEFQDQVLEEIARRRAG